MIRQLSYDPKIARIPAFLFVILIAALMVDAALSNLTDILGALLSSESGIILFSAVAVTISFLSVFLIYRLTSKEGGSSVDKSDVRNDSHIRPPFSKVISVIQYVISAIVLIIVLQVLIAQSYSIYALMSVFAVGSITGAVFIALLSLKFWIWYRVNKTSIVTPMFASATALKAAAVIFFSIGTLGLFTEASSAAIVTTESHSSVGVVVLEDGSSGALATEDSAAVLYNGLMSIGGFLLVIDFILLWTASALLLRNYYSRLGGKGRYWLVLGLPLVLFLVGVTPTLLAASSGEFPFLATDLLFFRVLTVASVISAGILFGVAFLLIGRAVRRDEKLRGDGKDRLPTYLRIAGVGIAITTASLMASVYHTPYPPFGAATSPTVALGSYLFFFGIYSSAISISQDASIRKTIRKSAAEHSSKMLGSMGTAQMEQELQQRVLKIAKTMSEEMQQETGVESSLSEYDIKHYLEEVLTETRGKQTRLK